MRRNSGSLMVVVVAIMAIKLAVEACSHFLASLVGPVFISGVDLKSTSLGFVGKEMVTKNPLSCGVASKREAHSFQGLSNLQKCFSVIIDPFS